jgi:catechol 2,3-dioxygenase-like lactoylglutathione lyase family enzyme
MPLLNSSKLIGFIATRDAARAKAFYAEKLGLRLISEDPFAVVFDANGNMLRVTPVREMALAGCTVLGWEVADIAASTRELQDAGVVWERFPGLDHDESGVWTAPGGRVKVAWFKDPDGNILSVSQHL